MKILIATGLYPPEIGGPATFAKLAETTLSTDGHDVVVVPFARARRFPKLIRHTIYFFQLLQQASHTDVIMALDAISVGVPARLLATLTRTPFIVRLGGDYAWEQGRQRFSVECTLDEFNTQKKLPLPVRVLRWLQTSVVRSADRVIAPSKYLKTIITSWGIRGEQVEVIYSVSVVEPPAKTASPAFIEGLALSHKRPIVLSVARLVPWKGFLALLDVIAELKTRYPDILLLIGGDGPQFATLEKHIHSLGLEAHVRLLGRLSRPALEELSQHVDMFVLNTEYEGFSHLLAEYMQLGVPIITTKVGGNPELITDQVSGMLVDYNDQPALATAISELTENETLRQSIIAGATKRATEFAPEKSLDRLRAVLEAVVKQSV